MPLPTRWWRWQYSREAKAWDKRAANPAYLETVDEVISLLDKGLRAEGPVVDVGAGPGAHARKVSRFSVGVDLAPAMLERAAARGGAVYVQADLGAGLPFRDDAFAGALGILVLQHVADVDAALAEMRRIVVRNGPIVITVPSKERPPRHRMGLYWSLRPLVARVAGVIHRFSIEDVQRIVAGFDVAELYSVRAVHVALLRNTKPL